MSSTAEIKTAFPRIRGLSTGVIVGLCVIAGSMIGLLVVPRAPDPEEKPGTISEVLFNGTSLNLDDSPQKEAKNRLSKLLSRSFTLKLPDSPSIVMPLSKWGAQLDEERLSALLRDVRDASSPLRKLWAAQDAEKQASDDGPLPLETMTRELPLTLRIESKPAAAHLMKLKDAFDMRPRDARLDMSKMQIRPHTEGRYLDVDATIVAIQSAIHSGEFSANAVVAHEKPSRTKDQLKGLSFEKVLGHFETRYSRSNKAADRTYNLRLAAEHLDGTVLLPGESFDFNEVVGPRDEANGYKVATVIANGELVDGIGGGTCQISGTLHGAAFFAGLDIIERYPHTRPSSYIKMGMDATVVYPTINFRFKNPFDFPIAIHQRVEGGTVRAEILGPAQDQVVTLIRKIDQAIPYEEIQKRDPKLPRGTSILAQRGIPGFRLHRYRTIRRGSHTTRERWRDVYPPTPQVIRIGTGDSTAKKRSSVGAPEYKADEVLILTLRRPQDGKAGAFAENREPGRYGKDGWTKESGMSFWDGD